MPNKAWYQPRFTPAQYQEIRDLKARGKTQVQIAAFMDCSQNHISRILRGKVVAARNGPETKPLDAQ